MTRGRAVRGLGAALAPVLLCAGLTVVAGRAGADSTVAVLPNGFGSIAVDGAHGHVFVSSPASNLVSVVDYSGHVVQTLTGETGAGSMAVYNGSMYVVTSGGIDVFSTTTLAKTGTLAAGGLVSPGPLVAAGGKLWTSTGACTQWSTKLVSVDPVSGSVTQYSMGTATNLSWCIGLAASPYNPDVMLAWTPGLDPATITEFDVSSGSPVVQATQRESDQANLKQAAFNPDGSTFVTASGSPYNFEEFGLAGLGLDGLVYGANAYPDSVVTSSALGGVIVGTSTTYANDIYVYRPGQGKAVTVTGVPGTPDDAGLALTPDGSQIFDVVTTSANGTELLIVPLSGQTSVALAGPGQSVPAGQTVTFTATVTGQPLSPAPTGTVTFSDNGAAQATVTLTSGQASWSTSWPSAGNHVITAAYSGDSANHPSSAQTTVVVGTASSTSATSSADPSLYGQSVTFTASVSGASPTGTVTFTDGPAALGTVALGASDQAAYTTSMLGVGSHLIGITYSGDANNAGSSAQITQVVNSNLTASTTSLSVSPDPAAAGQSVTLSATVTGSAPTGTVTFETLSAGQKQTLGTAQLSNGQALLVASFQSAGTYDLVADYSGDQNNQPSTSNQVAETIQHVTTTNVTSTPNPADVGQAITFTANVSGLGSTGNGSVTFSDNGNVLATVSLSGAAAQYVTTLPAGAHTITAAYSGDSNDTASSSSPLSQTVNPAPTITGLQSSVNPVRSRNPVTFTATVKPGTNAYTLTGSVTFYLGTPSPRTALGTVNLSGLSASLTVSNLPVGSDTITATYNGNPNFASSSGQMVETVRH